MNKLTYPEAYDKIIQAYFRDEIRPENPEFCFCGTLCGSPYWYGSRSARFHRDFGPYNGTEYVKMEAALCNITLMSSVHQNDWEDVLFSGMCAALDVLKQIHKDRGENVDDLPALKKRELNPVI